MKYAPLAFVLLACATTPATPPPTQPTPAPPPEISTIILPVTASLAPLLPQLEAQVPKSMAKLDAYELDPQGRFGLKYRVTRDPIELHMVGAGLHVKTDVHYALEGCARAGSRMWPCISCGFGEPMRDAEIRLHTHVEWDQSWRLRTKTTAQPVEFPNKCGVTILNINISDWKLKPLVNQQLAALAKTIDANAPKLSNVRPQAQQVWTSLQSPIPLAPRTWLVLEPQDVAFGPIRGNGLDVMSTLALRVRTRVVVGEKPVIAARPLPALRISDEPAGGFRVPFSVELTYAEASRLMNEQFAGKKFGDVTIESLRLAPSTTGRIAVEATVAMRHYHGLVTLDGIPSFDAASSSLSIADLDYKLDAKRKNPFVRVADRVSHDTLRQRLRDNARWPVGKEVGDIRSEIDRAMVRRLGPGVMLHGHVTAIQPVDVLAGAEGITVRVVAVGDAELKIEN
jgi:hypothetical protein